ncbi:MAG: TonB-dependent receptor [Paraglaciecola sp.]|nr:TonB-dependent receptor [Paraglaciecola sp.]
MKTNNKPLLNKYFPSLILMGSSMLFASATYADVVIEAVQAGEKENQKVQKNDSPALETIIVTSQKRLQNIQEVPIAVTALYGDILEQAGINNMTDLQGNVPSLTVNTTQSASVTSFGIRGVYTSSSNLGLESSVGLYADDVYRARQSSMINNMVDIERVEVLRGPQGSLFGRNTPSGAVIINSVAPDHDGAGFLKASYGNLDMLDLSGAKSFSVIDDVLAFRAAGFYTKREGYLDGILPGGVVEENTLNDRNRWGVRLQALFEPTDDFSVLVIADHSEIDEVCCGASTWKNNYVADGVPEKTGSDVVLESLGGTVLNGDNFYDGQVSLSLLPEAQIEDKGISAKVNWQTDSFELTSITAYREFQSHDKVDIDFTNLDMLLSDDYVEQNQFSQELHLSEEFEHFNYVAGMFYYHQELDYDATLLVGEHLAPFAAATIHPAFAIPGAFPDGTGSLNTSNQELDSFEVFGQMEYNIFDSLMLTAGLRWTKEDKTLINTFTEDASPGNPLAGTGDFDPGWGFWAFTAFTPTENLNETLKDDRVTGTVKLSWLMDDDIMFYTSYGTGYKAGGTNTARVGAGVDVVFDPEVATSYEIGMKAEFPAQALRVNVAMHATDTDDLQTSSFHGTGLTLSNAGVAETWGTEIDINWQATDSLYLTLAYAYNHATYEDFENGSCWVGTPWHTDADDPALNSDGYSCNRSGGAMADNAENVFVMTGKQSFDLSENISAFAYGEVIYTGERMTDVNNDPLKYDDAYTIVNLRTGVYLDQWDAEVTLWARNLLNENYTNQISDTLIQTGNLIGFYVEPRTFGITVKKHF